MVWLKDGQFRKAIALDLSIILGPDNHFLGIVPPVLSCLYIESDLGWIPQWRCPVSVFDHRAAQHLFLLRALREWNTRYSLTQPPGLFETEFPDGHQRDLLRRVYPQAA